MARASGSKDKILTDTDSLSAPDILAAEIADDLEAAVHENRGTTSKRGARDRLRSLSS